VLLLYLVAPENTDSWSRLNQQYQKERLRQGGTQERRTRGRKKGFGERKRYFTDGERETKARQLTSEIVELGQRAEQGSRHC